MIKPQLLIPYLMVFGWLLPAAAADKALFEPYQRLLTQHLTEATTPGDGLVSAFDYESALEGRAESVAFWINAYNFFMLEQILTGRPDGKRDPAGRGVCGQRGMKRTLQRPPIQGKHS